MNNEKCAKSTTNLDFNSTNADNWAGRNEHMRCKTCMYFVKKYKSNFDTPISARPSIGRCRRHAPTMKGYPAVFEDDWCGDHKIDENKI